MLTDHEIYQLQKSYSDPVEKFKHRYRAIVGESRQYRRVMNYQAPQHTDFRSLNDFTANLKTEYAIEVILSKESFEFLIKDVENIDSKMSEYRAYASKMQQESQIRKSNPALQKAWDNYQLLLRLCK